MDRRAFVLGLLALTACASPEAPAPGPAGQIIVLRHADRNPGELPLNERGRARAAGLPAALADLPVDAIFTLDLERNLDTAAPLAAARGAEVTVLPDANGLATVLTGEARGRSIVWVGNRLNLDTLWQELGAPGGPPSEYGEIAILRPRLGGVFTRLDRSF